MKIKISIQTRMLINILTAAIIIFSLAIGYTSYQFRRTCYKNARIIVSQSTTENALIVEKELSEGMSVLKTLAESFTIYKDMPEEQWKPLFKKMYYEVFQNNPQFYKLWDSWEFKQFDPNWQKDYGRYAVTLYRSNGMIYDSESIRSVDGDPEKYAEVKRVKKNMLWEPYWDVFVEQSEEKHFMTSMSAPVFKNGEFAGIVAADIIMDSFQKLVEKIHPFDQCTTFLVSHTGIIVGHSNKANIGKPYSEIESDYEKQFDILKVIKQGEAQLFDGKDVNGKEILLSLHPIRVGDQDAPWALGLMVQKKVVLKESTRLMFISIVLSFLGLVILSFLIFLISRNLGKTLSVITQVLQKLSKGDIDNSNKLMIHTGDEIENMAESVNTLLDGLNQTSEFAREIGKGNLDAHYIPLSEVDTLGNSLLEMRKSLQLAEAELEKRKIEDEKTNWTTNGLALFSEILRTNAQNISELTYNILKNLINYIGVNQGTIFVIDDAVEGEPEFEIKAAIAYDRRKFMQKRIAIGEDLVGRCAYEKKTIYMTDIPKNYIQITSGMGSASPTALLLVPLVLNDEIFGIIELASFHPFEPHKIAFVEKLGESIASTISTVKVNERTTNLLNQSKHQAEELAAQEEEMRQNLEELQATQEEAARRESETNGIVKALGTMAFIVEYDLDGNILNVNDMYAKLLGTEPTELIGKNHAEGFDFSIEMRASYDRFWNDLRHGMAKKEINKLVFNRREIWVEESYTPIYGLHDTKPYKILKIGFDITEQKRKEEEIRKQELKLREEEGLLDEYKRKVEELEDKIRLNQPQKNTSISKEPIINPEPKIDSPTVQLTQISKEKELLEWEPAFEVGITELDEQHQKMIELANQLYVAIRGEKNKKEIKEHFRSLIDFASYHFGNEENYFDQFDFTEKKGHNADHKAFLNQIGTYQIAFNSNKPIILAELLEFMHRWFGNHYTNFDQQYEPLFRSKGLK